jgi:hypothetical protein
MKPNLEICKKCGNFMEHSDTDWRASIQAGKVIEGPLIPQCTESTWHDDGGQKVLEMKFHDINKDFDIPDYCAYRLEHTIA